MNRTVTEKLCFLLCLILAAALQIQATFFADETYLGLRVNVTDLLLPFAGAAILWTLVTRRASWPQWPVRGFYAWIAVVTGVFGFALLKAYYSFGEVSQWALLNKFCGWIILSAVMGMGGGIAANAREKDVDLFLKGFLYFSVAAIILPLSVLIAQSYAMFRPWTGYNTLTEFPLAGLMANRNAHALVFMSTITLATCLYFGGKMKGGLACTVYFILPFYVIFNGSRASLAALCVVVPLMILLAKGGQKKIAPLLLSLLAGTAVFLAVFHDKPQEITFINPTLYEAIAKVFALPDAPFDEIADDIESEGDQSRLIILQDAFEQIRQNPVFGSGLGSAFFYQAQKHGRQINVIDSTPLWLLTETGLAGLMVIAAFGFVIVRTLFTLQKSDDDGTSVVRQAVLFMLVGFAMMSALHEIFYTRHIWFLTGLALCLPVRMRRDG